MSKKQLGWGTASEIIELIDAPLPKGEGFSGKGRYRRKPTEKVLGFLEDNALLELLPYLSPTQRKELDQLLVSRDPVLWLERNFMIPEPRDPMTGEVLAEEGPIKIASYQAKVLREALRRDDKGNFAYATILWSEVKKTGKCCWAEDRLLLADGSWCKFSDLVGRDFQVVSLNEKTLDFVVADAYAINNGIEDCWEITTRYGRKFVRTAYHKFLTFSGWKPVEALQVGEKIGVPLHLPVDGEEWLSDDEVAFLGYIIADGCLGGGSVIFTQSHSEASEDFLNICGRLGVGAKRTSDDWRTPSYRITNGRGKYNPALELVGRLGLMGKLSGEKFIPDEVLASTPAQIALFLNKLFTGDGWVEQKDGVVAYGTISERLAQDVVRALLRLNIQAKIAVRPNDRSRTKFAYTVYIQDAESVLDFCANVGFTGRKSDELVQVATTKKQKWMDRARDIDVLSKDAWRYLGHKCICEKREFASLGIGYWDPFTHAPKRRRILAAATALNDEWLMNLCQAPVGWDKIINIKHVGELPTVAVEVPQHHTFLTEAIEHNTTIAAGVALYIAWTQRNSEVYCVANDGKQSKDKIYAKIRKCITLSSKMGGIFKGIKPTRDRVDLPNGSFIEAISCDPSGEAGGEPTLTVFSELQGFRQTHKQRLWCYDDQTEILTKRGWIHGVDLVPNDIVATVTPKTHILEWETPKSILKEHYTGEMHLYENRVFSECVTPGHRLYGMFGRRQKHGDLHHEGIMKSSKLREYGGYNTYYPRTNLEGHVRDNQCLPIKIRSTYKKDALEINWNGWCEYIGWYLSEGRVKHNKYKDKEYPTAVLISQSREAHPAEWERIRCLHNQLFPVWKLGDSDTSFKVYSIPLAEKVKADCGSGTRNKRIPENIKNTTIEGLRRFFDAFVGGDGYIQNNGSIQIAVGCKRLTDDLSEVALKLGYRVSMKRMVPKNKNWYPYWKLHLTPYRDGYQHELSKYKGHWKTVVYDGIVWCPSTRNGLLVIQRNGKVYVSGNSEMTIPPTKWGHALRWAESYAGYSGEDSILEQLYDTHVADGDPHPGFPDLPVYANKVGKTLAFWSHEGRHAWHTSEYYSQEEENLMGNEFRRMHKNEWVSPEEGFVDPLWWDACKGAVPPLDDDSLIIAVDAAVSDDSFAIVGVTRHPDEDKADDQVVVRLCRIWEAPKNGTIDYQGTELSPGPEMYLRWLIDNYNVLEVDYDAYQLHDMMSRLRREGLVKAREFSQGGERLEADSQLRKLIMHRRLTHDGDPLLAKHIANSMAKTDGEDRKLRIVKASRKRKVDGAVATSMASHRCLELNL